MPTKAKEEAVDELADLPNDGDTAFEEKEKETPVASPAKETKEDEKEEPSPEGDKIPVQKKEIPFHEHPRWKQREKDWEDRYHALEDTYNAKFQELEQKVQPKNDEIPKWFSTLYGQNLEAWNEYSKYESSMRANIKAEALAEVKKESDKQVAETKRWNSWVEKSIQDLEEEGLEFDKNELMKIAMDYQPSDAEGNISFRKAYEILVKFKGEDKPKSAAKRELAATTVSRSQEGSKQTFLTPKDVRNKDWRSLI